MAENNLTSSYDGRGNVTLYGASASSDGNGVVTMSLNGDRPDAFAVAHITLALQTEVDAYYRYYLLRSSTLSKPDKPTTNPPVSPWNDTEPTYTAGSTNSLYFVDLTVFTDGSFLYSDVSLSSSYEAAKEAYNKAVNTESNLTTNYYTKTETDANITTTSDRITSTVSANTTRIETLDQSLVDVTNNTAESLRISEENTTQITNLVQQASGFEMNFTTITNTITELNDQFYADKDERISYIRFEDGKIYLGKQAEADEDDFQMVISNEKISFLQNGVEVAYLSNNKLYITDAQITGSLRIGNYLIQQRTNGNLGIRWVD